MSSQLSYSKGASFEEGRKLKDGKVGMGVGFAFTILQRQEENEDIFSMSPLLNVPSR